jgi:ankyrin repeat protein
MINEIFSNRPFQKPNSQRLIQAAKLNDIETCTELLHKNRYLVYDFDHAYLTALHWTCKRGFFDLSCLLVQFGSDTDAFDIVGRSCTYLAAYYNQNNIL